MIEEDLLVRPLTLTLMKLPLRIKKPKFKKRCRWRVAAGPCQCNTEQRSEKTSDLLETSEPSCPDSANKSFSDEVKLPFQLEKVQNLFLCFIINLALIRMKYTSIACPVHKKNIFQFRLQEIQRFTFNKTVHINVTWAVCLLSTNSFSLSDINIFLLLSWTLNSNHVRKCFEDQDTYNLLMLALLLRNITIRKMDKLVKLLKNACHKNPENLTEFHQSTY